LSLAGQYLGRFCAAVVASLIIPIALPAWTIERIVNHYKPGWNFGPFTATPYFLTLTLLSSLASLYLGTFWIALATYVMTAMQLLTVWLCISIALGRPGDIYIWLREFGRRKRVLPKSHVLLTPTSLYVGIISYGYTIYFFAYINFIIHRFSPDSFGGVTATAPVATLWTFVYYSTITITTLGYGDIVPKSSIAQAVTVIELLAGFFFVVFLFGAYVSYQVGKLR
jgi:hypothetical protein